MYPEPRSKKREVRVRTFHFIVLTRVGEGDEGGRDRYTPELSAHVLTQQLNSPARTKFVPYGAPLQAILFFASLKPSSK